IARFFSFASFEIARFIGDGTDQRVEFLRQLVAAAPFVVAAAALGFLQTGSLIVGLFLRRSGQTTWTPVRNATIALVVLLCLVFTLSAKDPASHTFYVTLPVAMVYACTFWAPLFQRPIVRKLAVVLLVCGAITHVTLAWRNLHLRSLYTNRAVVM